MKTGRRWLWIAALGVLIIADVLALIAVRDAFVDPYASERSVWQREYWKAVDAAEAAQEHGAWESAARLYSEVANLTPYDPVPHYQRATALARLERSDEALAELREAVELGWTDLAGPGPDSALEGIRGTAEFEHLLNRAQEIADEQIVVYVPPNLDPQKPAPLIVTFHGVGENPHRHIRSWQEAADRLGAVVAAPRGIAPVSEHSPILSFRWVTAGGSEDRRDFRECQACLEQAIELAGQRADIDVNRVLLAGYSQGGSVALSLLTDAPERARGAVVEATAYSRHTLDTWEPEKCEHAVRVYIIVHEFDQMRPEGEEAFQAMVAAGIDARLEVVAGADHELPTDHADRQVAAVRFVLGIE